MPRSAILGAVARTTFDAAYYRRFYESPQTRVASGDDFGRLARYVAAYLAYLEQPVERVLDLGCGTGTWQGLVQSYFGGATYTGVEVSPYLCRRYGWIEGSADTYEADEPFDLVICQGVLQYLNARRARRAIKRMAKLSCGALYLQVLTSEDWRDNVDQTRTDGQVYLRSAQWYRDAREPMFTDCGGGLFLSRESPSVLFALEGR